MNTFKLVLAVCSIVAVTTCSGQYTQSGRPTWESQTVSQPLAPVKTDTGSKYQTLPANTNIPSSAFPTITQQVCTCTTVPESIAAGMLEKYQQPSSNAATAQSSTSAQQAAYSQGSQQETLPTRAPAQNWYHPTTAASVEVTRQDPNARPAYATPAKVNAY